MRLNMLSKVSSRLIVPATESVFLPFLYETRTLKTPPLPLRKSSNRFRSRCYSTQSAPQSAPSNTPSEGSSSQDGATESSNNPSSDSTLSGENASSRPAVYIKKKAAATISPGESAKRYSKKPRSTVTRGEKEVFDRLFAKLGSSPPPELEDLTPRKEEQKQKQISSSTSSSSDSASDSTSDSATDESAQISAIFQESLEELKRQGKHGPGLHAASRDTSEQASHVRRLEADRVYKKLDKFLKDGDSGEQGNVKMSRLIQLVVQRESEKIENELRRAIREGRGDLGVWKICEERIFGMLRQLEGDGLEPAHLRFGQESYSGPSELVNGQDSMDADEGKQPENATTDQQKGYLDIPPNVPKSAVISSVYSHMLLVVFHLLRTYFPRSPLIGEIRPTIQSYGRASVVLGASTKLYNELIRFYWRGCDDLATVVSLLKEMEETGIEPDTKTYRLVWQITSQREREKRMYIRQQWRLRRKGQGQDSHVARTSWMETEPNRHAFRELVGSKHELGWVDRIRLHLEERGILEEVDKKVQQDLERLYGDDDDLK
ncbi:hypothetical protein VTN77DRAFT_8828 [Rasamsonia byssochlamydoides]|uniref:uncharacterized protein n=1 Tax=Rasamsonia byssochlamydoides TaxID=89139 RepID=UPI003741F122